MTYEYEFDKTPADDLRMSRSRYETLQKGLRLLRDELEGWNQRALAEGAAVMPYKVEVADLDRMIDCGDQWLAEARRTEIVVREISIGSLRYASAGLLLLKQRQREDRSEKARQGWPDAALRSLDEEVDRTAKIAETITYEPSEVLWQVMPQEEPVTGNESATNGPWDAFISHASEDKETFVRSLAEGLRARGLSVWYDELTLTVGDSLRRSIDKGLALSRFGIVVISPAFLKKEWPQKELDGLVAREVDGTKVILPVWHDITAAEVRAWSPTLADRIAASSSNGLDQVTDQLTRAIGSGHTVAGAPRGPIPRPEPLADVRVTLRGAPNRARFFIENWGPRLARDVTLAIEPKEGQDDPLLKEECHEKLPVEILRPGARVELIAALTFSTGTTFTARWTWRDENGAMQERQEKVSLQSY